MENELLKIFDDQRNPIGVATRAEVHRLGHWHEAFHCWIVNNEEGEVYIYLQIRSENKKDYPNLIDITAAGHLLSHETVRDGIREVKEELGIEISIEELTPLGVINYCVVNENEHFIDKELAHIFLYNNSINFKDFTFQLEEVSGILKTKFNAFTEFWLGERDEISVEGIKVIDGITHSINEIVGRESFVPHEQSYYEDIIRLISKHV